MSLWEHAIFFPVKQQNEKQQWTDWKQLQEGKEKEEEEEEEDEEEKEGSLLYDDHADELVHV